MDDTRLERLRKEREFYLSLLGLTVQNEIEPLLEEALDLIIDTTGAKLGYIAIGQQSREWSIARGCGNEQVARIRGEISRGIIAESLASGELIQTASAISDPRFSSQGSVNEMQIEAVLCAPIGAVPLGVVYLQGSSGGGPFGDADLLLITCFARQLALLADRLMSQAAVKAAADPTLPWRERLDAECLIGGSEAMARLLCQVHQASLVDIDVLLTGPTGGGKTLVARVIAANSARSSRPFVELNCAAIPEGLLESELFGAEKGAHSTATKTMLGKVEAAAGGTLFLDEVVELSTVAQAKLLQFLHSRTYYPLGSARSRSVDVRIIAASNVPLPDAVEDKRFRADLMHRLTVFSIDVPGLSERSDDIPALAQAACEASARRHGLGDLRLGVEAINSLSSAHWPGNVRQLLHTVEAGLVRAFGEGVATIRSHHLFPDRDAQTCPETWHEATLRFQAEFLRGALVQRDWNVAQTARDLELARSHIYRLMELHRIRR